MDVSARWDQLMERPEDSLPLDEALLLISARANRELDVAVQLRRLDELAEHVQRADTSTLCRVLSSRSVCAVIGPTTTIRPIPMSGCQAMDSD